MAKPITSPPAVLPQEANNPFQRSSAKRPGEFSFIQRQARRLTAWQRNQWARAGYPATAASLDHFSNLARRR